MKEKFISCTTKMNLKEEKFPFRCSSFTFEKEIDKIKGREVGMQVKNEQMRKRILEVAESFFLTKGFKETTMKDIAAKVPTAVGNLYTYFHSKSEMLDALVYPSLIKLDEILIEHYEEIYEKVDKELLTKLVGQIPDFGAFFNEADTKALYLLMERNEGSHYKHYQNCLMELLQNYLAGFFSREESIYPQIMGHLVILKLENSISESMVQVLDEAREGFKKKINVKDLYHMKAVREKRQVYIQLKSLSFLSEEEKIEYCESFWKTWRELEDDSYELVLDISKCAQIDFGGIKITDFKTMLRELEFYKQANPFRTTVITCEENVAMGIQYRRLMEKIGMPDVRLLIQA